MKNNEIHWERKQFKGHKVWLMVDQEKKPIVKDQKVLIKYNLEQNYEYWVHPNSVKEIDLQKLKRKKSKAHATQKGPKTNPSLKAAETICAKAKDANIICIFTDGASSGNPGPAGIGVVLRYGEHEKEISRSIDNATNNVAELEAIRVGLTALKQTRRPIRIFTDSAYSKGVLSLGWKAQKNTDLIRSIKDLMSRFEDIELIQIPGHSGIPENERADALAVAAVQALKQDKPS